MYLPIRRTGLAGVVIAVAFPTLVSGAGAEAPTKICVPEAASKPMLSASAQNECPTKNTTKYKTESQPGPAELETLDRVFPHVNYVEGGVGGKPTMQFSGVNVQVVNGEGKTDSVNGKGNLVIGYDEKQENADRLAQSHPRHQQAFTSYGGIVGGLRQHHKRPRGVCQRRRPKHRERLLHRDHRRHA